MDQQADGQMGGQVDRQMNEWTDGWARGQNEGVFYSIFELRSILQVTASFYTKQGCSYT